VSAPELFALTIDVPAALADAVGSRLFDAGLRGLEEQPDGERTRLVLYGEDRRQVEHYAQAARDFLAAVAEFAPEASTARLTIERQERSDWATVWRKFFKPTPLSDTLIVQPPWETAPPPPGAQTIIIEPKMAFGVGTHATTRLAARSVERFCRAHAGCRVLDVGAGTGILAIVAVKSGAAAAVGVDHDPVAVDTARENAALNHCAEQTEFSDRAPADVREAFDLVVANLTTPVLTELADELVRVTAPAGLLSMTGVLAEDGEALAAEFVRRGMKLARREDEEEWRLLEVTRV
jgi:ribosomal protein L11 methyltransferase